MVRPSRWLARAVERGLRTGLERAYQALRVDPGQYFVHLQRAYGVPFANASEMRAAALPLIDHIAGQIVRSSMKLALVEGVGLGLGGFLALVPDMGALSAITLRMIQKLSLVHGFDYATEEEGVELWIAMATAVGVDWGKELLDKQVVERFVPRLIERIACQAGSEAAEKWAARAIPLVGSALGGALNYYFVRAWGHRARAHFRERLLVMRRGAPTPMINWPAVPLALPAFPPEG
jgi:hypothetical protein